MTPNFPGMNPYLESPALWSEVHSWLIVEFGARAQSLTDTKISSCCGETGLHGFSISRHSRCLGFSTKT